MRNDVAVGTLSPSPSCAVFVLRLLGALVMFILTTHLQVFKQVHASIWDNSIERLDDFRFFCLFAII